MTRLARAVVVALAATTVALPLGTQPASAATCAAGNGVSVVVDFNGLGPGVATSCVPGGGGDRASALFAAAGHDLTRARRQLGFVCRVDDLPADDPCVNASPADAYWAVWWSDGTSGEWSYSTQGVDSLSIPDGGSVAFSWDDVDGSAPPSATPPRATSSSPTPSPTASPSTGGGGSGGPNGPGGSGGSGGATGGSGSGPGGAGTSQPPASPEAAGPPSAQPSDGGREQDGRGGERRDRDRDREREEGAAGADPSDAATAPSDGYRPSNEAILDDGPVETTSADADGLPVWVAPLALLVLAAGAGVAVVIRRRSAG